MLSTEHSFLDVQILVLTTSHLTATGLDFKKHT